MAFAHCTFHGCTGAERSQIRAYWEKRRSGLERLLPGFPEPLRDIKLTVRHTADGESQEDPFQTSALVQWTSPLAAQGSAPSWLDALDIVADGLARQIKRRLEQYRQAWAQRRKQRRRTELKEARPLRGSRESQVEREEFFDLLRPLMVRLRSYLDRELLLVRLQRIPPREQWTAEEVLDELAVRCWEQMGSRKTDLEPDVWVMKILQEVLDEIAMVPFGMSFAALQCQQPATPDEDPYDRFFRQYDLAVFADALSPERDASAWDALHRKKQQRRLEHALAAVPVQRRQAFAQHVLEAFTLAEVAVIQDRDASAVLGDVKATEDALRQAVSESGRTSRRSSRQARV